MYMNFSIFYMLLYMYIYMCIKIYLCEYRYNGCGIDKVRRKEMYVLKYILNFVDMIGLENVEFCE